MEINVNYDEKKGIWQTITNNAKGQRIAIREYMNREELEQYFRDFGFDEENIKKLIGDIIV